MISRSQGAITGPSLARVLGFKELVLITVGAVIGSGIFIVPAYVLRSAGGDVEIASAVWIAGGILSLMGALSYAELGAMNPEAGGMYIYLRDAFGEMVAFLYGWSLFLVIGSATLAALAVAFASYLKEFVPLSSLETKTVAVAMILGLAAINVMGTRGSSKLQNWSTGAKLLAIIVMSAMLLSYGAPLKSAPLLAQPQGVSPLVGIVTAMIGVLWTYEGWHYVTFSAGEAIQPQRTFPRAIVAGTAGLIGVYLLASLAYVSALGTERSAASDRIAAEAVTALFGAQMGQLIALLIMISIASAANAGILTAPRVYFAMARDGIFFRKLAEIHPRWGTPALAITFSSLWAAVLAASGTFEELLTYVIGVGWAFYGLGAASLFIYRRRQPQAPRPFRVPWYPWTPLLFTLAAGAIVVTAFLQHPVRGSIGLGIVLLGIPTFWFWRARQRKPAETSGS